MFQNISKDFTQEQIEDVELNKKQTIKAILKKCFSKQNVILYVICTMLSLEGFGENGEIAPFGIAILVAALSNCIPIGILCILVTIGTFVSFGASSTLNTLLIMLTLILTVTMKGPKFQETANEKRKLGVRLFIISFIIQAIQLFFREFVVYDVLIALMYSISSYIFYKIFVNGISVIVNLGEKRAYSIEEVMSASLLLSMAISAFGGLTVFGYSVRNILCILIVMIMGWKNGILVGATTGITIGTVLGVIGTEEPILVASFALSGMIAGVFNKLGKIGVVIGFIIGNVLLTYVTNGNTVPIILIQEILIASIGLLAVPKGIKINIEDINDNTKLLPETTGRSLEENKQTIYKLNSMSETIYDIARSYKEAAATIVDEEELKKQEEEGQAVFERELQNNLEGLEANILFDNIYYPEDNLLEDIFATLLEKERIERRDLLDILANHNNYIMGYENEYINDDVENDINQIVKAINNAYKVSKINFIWKKKLDESKKTVSNQLEEVSKAIGKLAENIENIDEDEFADQKQEIKTLLEQKEIYIKDCYIQKEKSGRTKVTIYTNTCEDIQNPKCDVKKIAKVISKVIGENMVIQKQECGLRLKQNMCTYVYTSEDKQTLQIGIAKATKTDSQISGDTSTQTKLEDGKYLVAISDGMGSGKEARKSSRVAIGMLEKLLSSGFEKDTSIKLINSSLAISNTEDMYATLDISILDLYSGNLEFIKNGACPTYIKNKRNVQVLKSVALPTGIVDDIDLIVYDTDLHDGDIIVMCTDGIIESCTEYTNKELWLKFLLEEIQTDDVQKIADIILNEAIDNNYGTQKDDMTVIVMKIKQK